MAQISRTRLQQPANFEKQAMQIGGGVVGGIYGGPQGAATGANIGGAAGDMFAPQQGFQQQSTVSTDQSAMDRRLRELENNDQKKLADSIDSLKYVQDPNLRDELAQPLLQAQYISQRKG